jgi:hypothetical protein
VGAVSDEDSLEEIESIAKVFALEQRMKLFTSPQKETLLIKKVIPDVTQKTTSIQQLATGKPLHHYLVKGLC